MIWLVISAWSNLVMTIPPPRCAIPSPRHPIMALRLSIPPTSVPFCEYLLIRTSTSNPRLPAHLHLPSNPRPPAHLHLPLHPRLVSHSASDPRLPAHPHLRLRPRLPAHPHLRLQSAPSCSSAPPPPIRAFLLICTSASNPRLPAHPHLRLRSAPSCSSAPPPPIRAFLLIHGSSSERQRKGAMFVAPTHNHHPKTIVAEGTVVRVVPVADGGGGVVLVVVPRAAPQNVSGLPGLSERCHDKPGKYTPALSFWQTGSLRRLLDSRHAREGASPLSGLSPTESEFRGRNIRAQS